MARWHAYLSGCGTVVATQVRDNKNLAPSLYFLRRDLALNGVRRPPSGNCRTRSRRDKGGSRMKRGSIVEGRQPVGKAGSDTRADEDAGRLADTLYALTRAIAAASANLRALKALGSGTTPNDAAARSTRIPGSRERSRS